MSAGVAAPLAAAAVGWLLAACAPAVDSADPAAPARAFAALAEGEYNNHQQFVEQGDAKEPSAHPQPSWHYRLRAVAAPAIGPAALLLTVHHSDDLEAVQHRSLWGVAADAARPGDVRMTAHRWLGAQRASVGESSATLHIDAEHIAPLAGCALVWTRGEGGYAGRMEAPAVPGGMPDACRALLPRLAERASAAAGRYQLSATGLMISERRVGLDEEAWASPALYRRVRYFSGYMAMRRSHIEPGADAEDMVFTPRFRAHSEGQLTPLLDGGKATGYALQLERLSYYRGAVGTPVLKIGVVEQSSGRTLAYSWASADAGRIGINLRWIQAGLTAEDLARPQ